VNIWQSYKEEGGCLVHYVRLATTLLQVEDSALHNAPFARNFFESMPEKRQFKDDPFCCYRTIIATGQQKHANAGVRMREVPRCWRRPT